jgi:hypothetical protein
VRIGVGSGTCKRGFLAWLDGRHHQHKRGGAAARRRARTRWRAPKARHATTTRGPGTTGDGEDTVLTYGQKGPGGEGVGEEGLDAVAAWCSEAEEGGGAHGNRVQLPPHGRLRLGEGRRRRASTDGHPRLLLILFSYVSGGGLGKGSPNRLGFEPRAAAVLK